MSAVIKSDSSVDESRRVVHFDAANNMRASKYNAKFAAAFVHMVENPDHKGLMSTHLFYDIPFDRSAVFTQLPYDAKTILSGGRAWERRVQEAAHKDQTSDAGYWSKDHSVTSYALSNGLMSKLPSGAIKLISYGGGDAHAFRGNELQIIGEAFASRADDIQEFVAVDILERFAFTCAAETRNAYGIESQGVLGDFIYNGKLAIKAEPGVTPVVMIFGGPFENTPSVAGGMSPQDATALAWAKLNVQHGLNTVVIKTCDTDQNPDLVNGPYAPSKNFEAFLLSAFARATQQGVIKDPQYDVFEHWKMTSAFNDATKAIELSATCKADHDVTIGDKLRSFKQGESRIITLSHKWDESTQVAIAQRAGFDVEIYREPSNQNIMMVAKAVRWPDADLLAHIPR